MFGNSMRVMGPPPRRTQIKGQDHMLAYINDEEASLLKALGGAGKPVHGVPAFYDEGDDYGGPGGDQSAGADGQQGSGNNNAGGGGGGGGREDGMDQDTSSGSNNQSSNNNAGSSDDGFKEAAAWSDWANTVGQNYPNTNNQTVDEMGNITTRNADGSTTTTLSQAQRDLNNARDTNDEAGKLADNIQQMIDDGRIDPYSSDSTNIQNAIIGSGMVSGLSREDRIAALEDLGRRVAMGETDNKNGKPSYDLSFLGGGNIKGWANNNPDITNEQMAQAFADGFNSQTGTSGIDVFGNKIGKGLGGTRLDVLANGDITIQSGGSKVGENVLNLAKSFYGGVPGSFIDLNFGSTNYDGWNKFGKDPNAPQANDLNISFDPLGGMMSQVVSPMVGKNIATPIGKKVFQESDNLALGMSAAAAANAFANSQIKEGLKQAGVTNTANIASIDLTGGQAGANPNVSTGKGSAVKGSATNTVQSDLSSDDDTLSNPATDGGSTAASNFAVAGDAPFSKGSDYTAAGMTYGGYEDDLGPDGKAVNATAPNANGMGFGGSVSTTTTSNDDGGQNDNKWLQLQGQIKDIIDQGQNTGANYLSPISYLSPASGRGFGNYLTRGKNRDYGSATFREASKNEIDRGKRRGGFGQIMFA